MYNVAPCFSTRRPTPSSKEAHGIDKPKQEMSGPSSFWKKAVTALRTVARRHGDQGASPFAILPADAELASSSSSSPYRATLLADWATTAWYQLQGAASTWLQRHVINTTNDKEWHFRTLFVAEVSILPFLLAFVFISFWLLNRNTHIRKTKGTAVPRRRDAQSRYEDDQEDENNVEIEDEDGAESLANSRSSNKQSKKRMNIQAKLRAYDVERDDDNTLVSLDALEDSDYEEELLIQPSSPSSSSLPAGLHPLSPSTASKQFLSKEKKEIWKIVNGQIPIFSYFNQEAMQMCMEYIEYVDLKSAGDSLWKEGTFDGSLYYVLNGKVNVTFHNFESPQPNESRLASVEHEAGSVVTSLLALCEGMVQAHLKGKSPLARFVGEALNGTSAVASKDGTRLLRVPPACFCSILERFPDTVLRVVQTVLNRDSRITVQILVRTCGLRQELLRPRSKELREMALPKKNSKPWKWIEEFVDKNIHGPSDLNELSDEDRKLLIKKTCTVFAGILGVEEHSSIGVLEEQCTLVVLENGHGKGKSPVLFEAGTTQDACYLLLKGTLELGMIVPVPGSSSSQLRNDPNAWYFKRIEAIQPGGLMGEDASFTTDVNLFEVRCGAPSKETSDCVTVLLRVPKDVYCWFITRHPLAMSLSLGTVLSMLGPLVHLLSWTSENFHVEAANEIAHRGGQCDSLFVVLNGRLRASNRSEGRERALGASSSNVLPPEEYGRGKIIGEVSALAGTKWPFDVFAIRQSELARVPVRILEIVAQNYPSAGVFLARSVASQVESHYMSRQRDVQGQPSRALSHHDMDRSSLNGTEIRPSVASLHSVPNTLPSYGLSLATIAVVPLTYNVDIRSFCSTLTKAMTTIAPTKLLTKSIMRQELGEKVYTSRNALNDLKMTRFLADMEENNRVVIYQADPKYTYWSRLCVRQADCILLVVDARNAPDISRVEQTLEWAHESMDVRIDLVVVGEPKADDDEEEDDEDDFFMDDDEISVSDQLNNWSESRKWISGHHLVRSPFERYRNDFRRMSRRITGRSVGLVLGGGGARGIAHVGVIRALIEAGVTVDLVGGTSQGAFCGALFAKNPDSYDEVESSTRAMAAQMASMKAKLFDLTLPLSSIFTGRSFNRGIRKLLGKLRIQDLVLNFFCVSVDLQKQTTVVHTKGLLWKYVRASMTLAGYLPPIAENGSLLVDGGYLNALPADIMKFKMGARTVIAVVSALLAFHHNLHVAPLTYQPSFRLAFHRMFVQKVSDHTKCTARIFRDGGCFGILGTHLSIP